MKQSSNGILILSMFVFLGFSSGFFSQGEEFPFYEPKKDKSLNVKKAYFDMGFGVASIRGAVGLGGMYFIDPYWDVHMNYGQDSLKTFGLGFNYHYFVTSKDVYYLGLNYLYSLSGSNTISTNIGNGNYEYEPGGVLEPTVGFAKKFIFDSFFWGLELNYRYWVQKPKYKFISGAYSVGHMEEFDRNNANMVAFGLYLLFPIY